METIKVNMNPNPLDVQTIHASQNDGEARQWGFELHNNGELIDTSEVTDQIVFKAYKGGTEQILPENGSTPTTSPFIGDIKYPQGLLSDQEFLYRESPTEEDGLAKITDIKGNTLVWNQLVSEQYSHTFTAGGSNQNVNIERIDNIVAGHKYLYAITQANSMSSNVRNTLQYLYSNGSNVTVSESNAPNHNLNAGRYGWIFTAPSDNANKWISLYYWCHTPNVAVTIKDAVLIDLTLMFGAGNEPSTVEEFTSLFSLPYYAYNQGTLLSFMGSGIKTVGFNQWDEEWEVGSLNGSSGLPIESANQIRSKNYCPCISGLEYYFHSSKTDGGSQNIYYFAVLFYDVDKNFVSRLYTNRKKFRVPTNASYFKIYSNSSVVVYGNEYLNDICINISSSRDGEYEPYTSSTLSLPISTYFSNGMKSAGSVYDELTESKAITRIGAVDLGSLNWIHRTEIGQGIFSCEVTSTVPYKRQPSVNFEVAQYINGGTVTGVVAMVEEADKTVCLYYTGNTNSRFIYVKNTAYSDATAFKTAMNGIPLYFEISAYQETSFTTASLVTENAEIPLSNDDGVLIGKCTEQLSSESGFFDAKIKLADEDGECYSNKVQLHIERSPQ